jgi:uncharacterized protein YkwD
MEVRMTRLKTRRTLRLETLESRALLSSPDSQQQYMLEMLNMARTNPAEMASWLKSNLDANDMATIQHYGVNLDQTLQDIANTPPVQPLALNDTLTKTALDQSQYEADNQVQTHQGPGEADLLQRLNDAGYTNPTVYGENSYAYAQSVDHAMKAFLIDWGVSGNGHRGNILQMSTPDDKTYSEVGIGIVATNPGSQLGKLVVTNDFGRPANFQPQVVGVVYDDQNGNHLYDIGEGEGGVSIVVDDSNGNQVAEATTWDSGGYQIPLAPGSYKVTAVDNGQVVKSQDITIGSDNVKVDFNTSQPWQGGSLPAPKNQSQPSVVVPVQTPVATPVQTPVSTPVQVQVQSPVPVSVPVSVPTVNDPSLVAGPALPNMDSSWLSSWSWWRRN